MSWIAERVEVYSGVQRRRRYSVDQKMRILQEASQPGITISYVARRHGYDLPHGRGWERSGPGRRAVGGGSAEVRALEKRVRELERVLGRKTLENEILREAVKVGHKKLIPRSPSLPDEGSL